MQPLILAIIGLVSLTSVQPPESQDRPSAQELVARTVQMLVRGDIRSVAESMHYPPSYTAEERTKDVTSTGAGLDFTAQAFGQISDPKPHTELATFYEVGGSGGTVGNIDLTSTRRTQHFLTLSIESEGRWFHLARYFTGTRLTGSADSR